VKVGDLIVSNTRYKGQAMIVIDIRTLSDLFGTFDQVRAVSLHTGVKTRWCRADTWKVVSESG